MPYPCHWVFRTPCPVWAGWAGRVLVLFSACLAANLARAEDAEGRRPPNVVLIFTDDQGTVDMNVYGAEDLTTPHMDGIARRGVRFTQFYAAAAVCSPSRAGLLTGRYPQRAGVPGNVSSMEGHAGMPTEQVTLADMFQAAGYATAHVGKWHLGYTPETMPNAQGFDFSFGHMGGCIDNWSHFSFFEGGIRVPAIIAWPGTLPEGEVRDQVAHGCDWLPTLAELCGVPLLEDDIDGVSLVDVVRSAEAPSPRRVLHWQAGRGLGASWAVRDGDWKLLGNPRDPSEKAPLTEADRRFLVNLAEDATEMTNLAGKHPEVAERLEGLHAAWLESID